MEDVTKYESPEIVPTDLPFARPDRSISSNIPEIGDFIWTWMADSENRKHWYYGNKVTLKEYHDTFKDADIKSKIALLVSTYPNLVYTYEKNGQ